MVHRGLVNKWIMLDLIDHKLRRPIYSIFINIINSKGIKQAFKHAGNSHWKKKSAKPKPNEVI